MSRRLSILRRNSKDGGVGRDHGGKPFHIVNISVSSALEGLYAFSRLIHLNTTSADRLVRDL